MAVVWSNALLCYWKFNSSDLTNRVDFDVVCTGAVLAYVFGRRQDAVFVKLQALLEPFGLTHYYTDHWGAYMRHLDPEEHTAGKRYTQKIERKHLTLRTRIKRLVHKTI